MKTLTLQTGKKQPIPEVPYSSLEASASATLEFDETKRKDEEVFAELEKNLSDALFHSVKVAEESELLELYNNYKELKEKYDIIVDFIKDNKLTNDFKTYKKQR